MELDKIDLCLARLRVRRRCTKAVIPITAHTAKALPTTAPTIAGAFIFLCGDFDFASPLAFMLSTGTLREGPGQHEKNGGIIYARTSELKARTKHLVQD
jgi:hypothetical protein